MSVVYMKLYFKLNDSNFIDISASILADTNFYKFFYFVNTAFLRDGYCNK